MQIAWRLWVCVFKCLAQAHSNDDTGRCRESNPSILNRRFWNIDLRYWSRVHICISKSNYHKVSCLGENNTQGTSLPWVNKQGNYIIFSANSSPPTRMPSRTPMILCMLGGFAETSSLPVEPDACGCSSTGGQVGQPFWHRSIKTFRGCSPWSVSYEDECLFNFTTRLTDFTQHFSLIKERRATD